MKQSTSQRLKEIMRQKGLKQVDILEKVKLLEAKTGTKLSKVDLSQYVNGKVEPRQDKLYVLALALNVSEAWLLGYDVPQDRITDKERNEKAHSTNIETIAAHINDDVTEEQMKEIVNFIEFIKNK